MKKTALIIPILILFLNSCNLFTHETDVNKLLNTYTQKQYNNLSLQQKVWLKYYCDIHLNNKTSPEQVCAVKRGITLYENYINRHDNDKRLKEKFESNYEYLKSFPGGVPYPEE